MVNTWTNAPALERARHLVALGLSVLPITPGTKHPPIKWKNLQERHPEPEELEAWFERECPVGIVCGKVSGLVVVDSDSPEAEAWAAENLPPTPWCVRTGESTKHPGFRGVHRYYRHPGVAVRNRARIVIGAGKLALDIRADGGQVLSPGSQHPSGVCYEAMSPEAWTPEQKAALPLFEPAWLEATPEAEPAPEAPPPMPRAPSPGRPSGLARARAWLEKREPAVEGQGGDAHTFATACSLVRGFDLEDSDALALLQEWNATCRPPWTFEELAEKVRNARAYGAGEFGALLDAPPANVVPLRRRADAPATSGALALAPGAVAGRVPRIVKTGNLAGMTAEALQALRAANADCPTVFAQDGVPVRLEIREEGARLVALDKAALRGHLDRTAEWVERREKKGEWTERRTFPPLAVVEDILALPAAERGFPPIRRITRAPVFGADGTLLDAPGYHAAEALYYLASNLNVPPVPLKPGRREVEAARALLLDDMLGDFPFTSTASRAHAVAATLLPFCRNLVSGPTVNHLVDAPCEGTGKTLLAKAMSVVFLGEDRMGLLTPAPPKAEEWPKRILATLRNAPPVILLDNVEGRLDSPALAQVLTLDYHEDRELGTSRTVRVPNLSTWITTGNNVSLSRELARRTVLIRLDAERENPEERTDFRHPNLLAWIRGNRASLVHACLVLIRAWLAAGSPKWKPGPDATKIGSFECWCEVLGGILDVAEVPGFLQNRQETKARAGEVEAEWSRFFETWQERFGLDKDVAASELRPLVEEEGHLLGVVDGKTPRAIQTRLGTALRGRLGRVYNGTRLVQPVDERGKPRKDRKGGALYRLQAMPAEPLPNLCGGSALGSAEENAHSIGVCGDVPNLPNLSSSSQQKNENGASMDAATLKICTDSRTGSAGSAEDVRSPENGTFSVPNLVPNLAEGSAEVRHNEQEELVEELF